MRIGGEKWSDSGCFKGGIKRVYTLDVTCEKKEKSGLRVWAGTWKAGLVTEMEDGGSDSP